MEDIMKKALEEQVKIVQKVLTKKQDGQTRLTYPVWYGAAINAAYSIFYNRDRVYSSKKDIEQECHLAILEYLKRHPKNWFDFNKLYQVAVRTVKNKLPVMRFGLKCCYKGRNRPTMLSYDDIAPNAECQYEATEFRDMMTKFLQKLTPRQKKVMTLLSDGKTEQQVADIIGVNQSTISRWRKKYYSLWKSFGEIA